MPDARRITVTGLFGFMPCFGVYLLLESSGRFYIAHMPETAHIYIGHRVRATGLRDGPNVLAIDEIAVLPARPSAMQ